MDAPLVSVCLTVRNSCDEVGSLLADLDAQADAPSFEVCIVDGFSTDGTWELLQSASVARRPLVLARKAGNISVGRNAAVRLAASDVVMTVDAGARVAATWVRDLSILVLEGDCSFVAGPYVAAAADRRQTLITVAITPSEAEFVSGRCVVSARSSCFRRVDFEALGGYPETLDHCEDLVFYGRLAEKRGAAHWVPGPAVTWDGRPTLRAFFRQYRLYARGDGMAGLYARRHALRYGYYAAVATAVVLTPVFGVLGAAASYALLTRRPRRRLASHAATGPLSPFTRALAACVVQVVGDTAKMLGYPTGLARSLAERRNRGRGRT